jgi:hypothetical protein
MRLPDYRGGSIVNLMASLQTGLDGLPPAYDPLALLPAAEVATHRQVLLLVIDGLGLNYLRAVPEATCLNAHLRGGITSVYPPTTATAVTTFLTGDAPQQHGLTGWHMYFRELGSVLAVLPGKARYGGVGLGAAGIDVPALFGHWPFADRLGVEAWSLAPAYIAGSDFNLAHLGRAHPLSYLGLGELLTQAAAILHQEGRRFVYGYWPELDSLGHQSGIWSERSRNHLRELDQALADFLEQIRGTDTLVVLCADHGQVDTTSSDRIYLHDHPALAELLVLPLCGEPRSAYCYLRPGAEDAFDAYVASALAGIARSFRSAELLESGWFGLGEPHPRLAQRIGDRVLLMQQNYILKDWLAQEHPYELIGVHGGLSPDELLVPLIVATA